MADYVTRGFRGQIRFGNHSNISSAAVYSVDDAVEPQGDIVLFERLSFCNLHEGRYSKAFYKAMQDHVVTGGENFGPVTCCCVIPNYWIF